MPAATQTKAPTLGQMAREITQYLDKQNVPATATRRDDSVRVVFKGRVPESVVEPVRKFVEQYPQGDVILIYMAAGA